jgi:hypothetical protein
MSKNIIFFFNFAKNRKRANKTKNNNKNMMNNALTEEEKNQVIEKMLCESSLNVTSNKLLMRTMPIVADNSGDTRCRIVLLSSKQIKDLTKDRLAPLFLVTGAFDALVCLEFHLPPNSSIFQTYGILLQTLSNTFPHRIRTRFTSQTKYFDLYNSLLNYHLIDDVQYYLLYSTPFEADLNNTMKLGKDDASIRWVEFKNVNSPMIEANPLISKQSLNDLNVEATKDLNSRKDNVYAKLIGAVAILTGFLIWHFKLDIHTIFTQSKSMVFAIREIKDDHNEAEDHEFARIAQKRAYDESRERKLNASLKMGSAQIEAAYNASIPRTM